MKLLFVCKQRETSWSYGASYSGSCGLPTKSSGLYNSVKFVCNLLSNRTNKIISKVVDVVDNNSIDCEVSKFKPDTVIIEAFWVVPEKFDVLSKLHPTVQWMVRLHSEIPFAATESIIFEWIRGYLERDIVIACNSKRARDDIKKWVKSAMPWVDTEEMIIYLPNIYPTHTKVEKKECHRDKSVLKIGCFGAIRPFKNVLSQAIAAIAAADSMGKRLEFHINGSRVEMDGNPVLMNILALFDDHPTHKLVHHRWYEHSDFLKLVRQMDVGMQVSFTETFNIVAADLVSQNVPIVVSDEIRWASDLFKVSPNCIDEMVSGIKLALLLSKFNLQYLNKIELNKYSKDATKVWLKYFC